MPKVCQWCSGRAMTTQSTRTPGIFTCRGLRLSLGHALHLRDDDAARIVRRHRDGERLQGQRLPFHRQVAVVGASGGADDPDVDGEGLVGEAFPATEHNPLDEVLFGAGVELTSTIRTT